MVYSTRRFVLCLTLCYFVLVFSSPLSIAINSLGEERANLSAFRTFVRFVLVWFCRFPLPLAAWKGLRLVIVALPGLFSYLLFFMIGIWKCSTSREGYFCREGSKLWKQFVYLSLRWMDVFPKTIMLSCKYLCALKNWTSLKKSMCSTTGRVVGWPEENRFL